MTTTSERLPLVDAARGVVIVAMVAYHFVWDLSFLGLATVDLFGDPLWLAARTAIVSGFLLLVGSGIALGAERGTVDPRRLGRRLLLVGGAAAGVSAMSYAMFPDSPIFFGVLHHIAVASILGLAFVRLPAAITLAAGAAVLVAGETLAFPVFDTPWLRWVGLMTHEPSSNDYVPLVPWFGVVLVGIGVTRIPRVSAALAASPPTPAALRWAGRHSLAVYLLHQPLLFGGLSLLAALHPAADRRTDEAAFVAQCVGSCTAGGQEPARCSRSCHCVAEGWQREGLWVDALTRGLPPEQALRADAVLRRCLDGR